MTREQRLCLWCQYLSHEAGFAYSELTWESGKISCLKNHWDSIYDDEPLAKVGNDLYTKFQTAITCPNWRLNENLVNIGVKDE